MVWESWKFLSQKLHLAENLDSAFTPHDFLAHLLDSTVGGVEQLTLHFHLLYVSVLQLRIFGKPLTKPLSSHIPTQNMWPRVGK